MKIKFNVPSENLALGHREYRGLDKLDFVVVQDSINKSEVDDPQKVLFDKIFAVNPVTGLPDGDIAMFMSENTSPEIKAFIQQQLMSPQQTDGDTTSFDGLSDDELVAMSRQDGESISSYRARMLSVVRENVRKQQELKNKQQDSKSD